MPTRVTTLGIAALGFCLSGCGGYGGQGGGSGNPTAPSDAIVINVVTENGAQSFSPNPATIPNGQMVVWHNVDRETHRVLLNDESVDTGNLAPGAFSAPVRLVTPGPYHCTIHPDMVGAVAR